MLPVPSFVILLGSFSLSLLILPSGCLVQSSELSFLVSLKKKKKKNSCLQSSSFLSLFPYGVQKTLFCTAAVTGSLKHGREELPQVRGQGQKPGGPHARRTAAKRSYPTSKVRGSGRECQTVTVQEQPKGATPLSRSGGWRRGVTPRPKSGAVAGRRYPTRLSPKPGAVAGRTKPTPWLHGHRRA